MKRLCPDRCYDMVWSWWKPSKSQAGCGLLEVMGDFMGKKRVLDVKPRMGNGNLGKEDD